MDFARTIHDAIKDFESHAYDADVKEIAASSVEDVTRVARAIEREREDRGSLCNLRRVETLLKDLQRLGGLLQEFPQFSCPVNYIWGPVQLALEIANKEDAALEAILSGYQRLSSSLRFLERVGPIPRTDRSRLQEIIIYTFCDVVDYHTRVFQALRRGGWALLFNATWIQLAPVFDCIVKRLDRSRILTDQAGAHRSNTYETINIAGNATAHLGDKRYEIQNATFAPIEDLSAAREFREQMLEDLVRKQKREEDRQFDACIKWLDLQDLDREQAKLFTRRRDVREEATCEWILSHSKVKAWLDPDSKPTFLWLKGKPGSGKWKLWNLGKTTLATYLIEHASPPTKTLMLYYLCAQEVSPSAFDFLNAVLSFLAAQILRKKRHLIPFVYETYVKAAEHPAMRLPVLLRQLLSCLPASFIIIDGLDECDPDAQNRLYNKLEWIVMKRRTERPAGPEVKLMVCSQDAKGVPSKLQKQPFLSLSAEHIAVSRDIRLYTTNSVADLSERFSDKIIDDIASTIVEKANGMFLWAKLVLQTLLQKESLLEIQVTLRAIPSGLTGVYLMLLDRMKALANNYQESRIRYIFYWVLFANRPMKTWEICDALVIGGSNLALVKDYTILNAGVLDICKPLIEVMPDQTVTLVHFSVKDFLLDAQSGPFIDSEAALHHISSTCLKYLFTCDRFFIKTESTETYNQIIMLAHGLFFYVAEAWKIHVASLVSISKEELDKESLLSKLIDVDVGGDHSPRPAVPPSQPEPQPVVITSEIVRRAILESLKGREPDADGETDLVSDQRDPIREAFANFQEQVEKVVDGRCPFRLEEMNVSADDLDQFKQRCAGFAFLCRWSQCLYSTRGFSNTAERDSHEQIHRQQFICPEFSCEFAGNGFSSRGALKKHIRRYHMALEDTAVPVLRVHRRRVEIKERLLFTCCVCGRISTASGHRDKCSADTCPHEFCRLCNVTLADTGGDDTQPPGKRANLTTETSSAGGTTERHDLDRITEVQELTVTKMAHDYLKRPAYWTENGILQQFGDLRRRLSLELSAAEAQHSATEGTLAQCRQRHFSSKALSALYAPTLAIDQWHEFESRKAIQLIAQHEHDYFKVAESLKKSPGWIKRHYEMVFSGADYHLQIAMLTGKLSQHFGKYDLPPFLLRDPTRKNGAKPADRASIESLVVSDDDTDLEVNGGLFATKRSSRRSKYQFNNQHEVDEDMKNSFAAERAVHQERRIRCRCGHRKDSVYLSACIQCRGYI